MGGRDLGDTGQGAFSPPPLKGLPIWPFLPACFPSSFPALLAIPLLILQEPCPSSNHNLQTIFTFGPRIPFV